MAIKTDTHIESFLVDLGKKKIGIEEIQLFFDKLMIKTKKED